MEIVFDRDLEQFRALVKSKGGVRKFVKQLKSKKRMEQIEWKEMFGQDSGMDWEELWSNISGIGKDIDIKVEYKEKQ